MKVLIPYDGTKAAENALLELQNAGFGQTDKIVIVITDVFLPESVEEFSKARRERHLLLGKLGNCSYIPARRRLEEERFLSRQIRTRLSSAFPAWNVKIEALPGSSLVSREILEKAAAWKADLIILGLQESEAAAPNTGYKSGLWHVASEAKCSVRFARGKNRGNSAANPKSPNRIIAVLDGTESDANVIEAVAGRRWTAESDVRLIKVKRQTAPEKENILSQSGKIVPSKLKEPSYTNGLPMENGNFTLNAEAKLLETAGLNVSTAILKVNAPPFLINREISDWKPDSVFIADTKGSAGNKFSRGQNISNETAEILLKEMACSIEIVRSTEKTEQIPKPAATLQQRSKSRREIKFFAAAAASL